MTTRPRKPTAKAADKPETPEADGTQAVKLNLAIAGVGAKNAVVVLPSEVAQGLIAMNHADPVIDADDDEPQAKPDEDGEQVEADPDAGMTDDERQAKAAAAAAEGKDNPHLAESADK